MTPPMSDRRPLFLLTNDDGVDAPGLLALRRIAAKLGDVIVVAPTREQSAQSHSITIHRPLRHIEHEPSVHSVDGTPADCVYIALFEPRFLPRRPDIVLSGVNHGHNLGTNVFYSGTVAAAREAALRDIPSIAFSAPPHEDVTKFSALITDIVQRFVLATQVAEATLLLNVNLPKHPSRGARVTTVGRQVYQDTVAARLDPSGREYFWIGGRVTESAPSEGTDAHAIRSGYASITPLALDSTRVEHWASAASIAEYVSLEGDK
jgi:5'-nucleotidase